MLSKEKMREVVLEHVDAENVHDPDRVIATYSRDSPVFEDAPSGVRYAGQLGEAEGEASFRERQRDYRLQAQAIESGLLRRALFVAERPH